MQIFHVSSWKKQQKDKRKTNTHTDIFIYISIYRGLTSEKITQFEDEDTPKTHIHYLTVGYYPSPTHRKGYHLKRI